MNPKQHALRHHKFATALTKCFFCLEDDCIVMNTRLTPKYANAVRELHGKVASMNPCQKCQDFMKQGIILIAIDDSKSESGWNKKQIPNPYRTGWFGVLTEDGFKRVFGPRRDLKHSECHFPGSPCHPGCSGWQDLQPFYFAIKHRFMFIEHSVAQKIGLIVNDEQE